MKPIMRKRDELVAVMAALGLKLEARGGQHVARCPFHDDKAPSLRVQPKRGRWHCEGCGARGGLIGFVQKMQGVSRFKAVQWLESWRGGGRPASVMPAARPANAGMNAVRGPAGGAPVAGRPPAGKPLAAKPDPVTLKYIPSPVDKQELLNNVVRLYHRRLLEVPEGRVYLQGLGLHDEGLYRQFQIGYADGSSLQQMTVNAGVKAALREIGILNDAGTEVFHGCVIFPTIDEKGNCLDLCGLRAGADGGQADCLGLNTKKGVWNWEAFTRSRTIIVTGSILEALALYQVGFTDVVPLDGANGLPADLRRVLERHRPERLYLALAGDAAGGAAPASAVGADDSSQPQPAGEKATEAVAEQLAALGAPCFRVELSAGKSVSDYFTGGHTRAEFEELLKAAEPVSQKLAGRTARGASAGSAGATTAGAGDDGRVTVTDGLAEFSFDKRRYQVREFTGDEPYRLRVNIRAKAGDNFHVDVFDLYVSKSRKVFANVCARLFAVATPVIEQDIAAIIEHLEKMRVNKAVTAKSDDEKIHKMTPEDEAEALAFLKTPDLLDRVVADLETCGYVGEELNKKIGYLITISRKLASPLSGVIISNVGAGKSKLMEHLAAFVPDEDKVVYTRITPQSLYYQEERSLKHKLIIMGEEAGLAGADYSLRELISAKVLRLAAPVKDPISGKLKTVEYEVEGPVALLFSTTAGSINYENATRCFELCLDESQEQTKRVHTDQRRRRMVEGIRQDFATDELKRVHQNAQRLLKRLRVVNPHAAGLKFHDRRLQSRREQEKYLSLIESIALLHQHQREVKVMEHHGERIEYLEATLADIEEANTLMVEILGQCLNELKKPSRELLALVKRMADERCAATGLARDEFKFNRRDIREYCGWSDYQVRTHIRQLEELQYIIPVNGKRGKMYKYELAFEGEQARDAREETGSGLTGIDVLQAAASVGGADCGNAASALAGCG